MKQREVPTWEVNTLTLFTAAAGIRATASLLFIWRTGTSWVGLTCSSINPCSPAQATDFPAPCFIGGRHCVYTLLNPPSSSKTHNLQCRHYICWMNCFNYEHGLHLSCNLDPGIIFDPSFFMPHIHQSLSSMIPPPQMLLGMSPPLPFLTPHPRPQMSRLLLPISNPQLTYLPTPATLHPLLPVSHIYHFTESWLTSLNKNL